MPLHPAVIGLISGAVIGSITGGILYTLGFTLPIAICIGVLFGIIILGTQVAFMKRRAAVTEPSPSTNDHTVIVVHPSAPIIILDEDPK